MKRQNLFQFMTQSYAKKIVGTNRKKFTLGQTILTSFAQLKLRKFWTSNLFQLEIFKDLVASKMTARVNLVKKLDNINLHVQEIDSKIRRNIEDKQKVDELSDRLRDLEGSLNRKKL